MSSTKNNTNENSESGSSKVLIDILEQVIKVLGADDKNKRRQVAKKAAITLVGVGALAGIDYILRKQTAATPKTESE